MLELDDVRVAYGGLFALQGISIKVAEGQFVNHSDVAIEQRLAAAFDAVGLNGGEAEDTVEQAADGGAEFLRYDDAPLGIQLFLEGREKHVRPNPVTSPPPDPRPPSPEPARPVLRRDTIGLTWAYLGDNDTRRHFQGDSKMSQGV